MTQRLIQLTDTHLFADPAAHLYGIEPEATLTRVLDDVRRQRPAPAVIIASGDLAHDESAAAYGRLARHLEALGVPVHYLPGNHDDPALMAERWGRDYRALQTVDLARWSLLLLSSHRPGEVGGEVGEAQLQALAAALAERPERPCLVAVHHHPRPVGSPWMDAIGLADAEALLAVLADAPQVRLVICGHVHQALEDTTGPVTVLGTPATCFQFRPHSEEAAVDERPPAYRVLDLHDDGRWSTAIHWLDSAP